MQTSLSRRQWWLVFGSETVGLLALLAWIALRLDRFDEPAAWIIGLIIILVGDAATALIMQSFARSEITVEPGERKPPRALADSDFDSDGTGCVLLRGERWSAQLESSRPLRKGEPVSIVARNGLTLIVTRCGESGGSRQAQE